MTETLYVRDDEAFGLYNINCILELHVRYFRETVLHFRTVDFFRETTLDFSGVGSSHTNRHIGLVVREDILDDILVKIDELKTEIEKIKKEIA